MSIFAAQSEAARLLFSSTALRDAGRLAEASNATDRLIAALEKQVQLAETNNAAYPDTPMDIAPIAGQLANALLGQADVVEALGKFEKAEQVRERALRISEKYLSAEDAAERQRQRANSLILQGRFNEALVAFSNARDLFEERGDKLLTATVTASIAGLLEWLGDFERARSEAGRALDMAAGLPRAGPVTTADVLERLKRMEKDVRIMAIAVDLQQLEGRVNRRLGNFAEAERQFREVYPHLPHDIAEAGIGFQLAALRIEQGLYQEGIDWLQQIEAFFIGLARPKLGVLLSCKSQAILGLGRPEEALALAEQACAELTQYRDLDSLWKAQWYQGRALAALDRGKPALAAFVRAATTVDSLRKAPLGYRLGSTYLRDKLPLFVEAIGLASALHEGETCCSLMESVKSRELTATLSAPAGADASASDMDRKIDELSSRLDALEYQSFAQGESSIVEQQRARLQQERATLLERKRFSDPQWRSLSQPVPFDIAAVLDLLAERNQAALSLFCHGDEVFSVLLMNGRCEVEHHHLSATTHHALAAYVANLQAEKPDPRRFDPSFDPALTADQLLPSALVEKAASAKSLIVVPHGTSHLVPWAGLAFREKRLFEYLPVGVLPNLSCILALNASFSKEPRVALIGDPDYAALPLIKPLFLARQEMERIADLYTARGRIIGTPLQGKAATETGFWALAREGAGLGGILHAVCHGEFVTADPMSSGLLFTFGKVDAAEIARARMPYDEVILSACATGRRPTEISGVALSGDDIVGLPGAFLEAGSRSVLVSIPAARDDAAMQFMTVYHSYRSEGATPLVALQSTQKEMLTSSLYEPYLWVGFTVYGCQ